MSPPGVAVLTRNDLPCTQEPPLGAWLRLRPHASAPDADCEDLGDISAALLAELVQQYRNMDADAALEVFVGAAAAGALGAVALGAGSRHGHALLLARQQRVAPALCAPRVCRN